MGLWIGGNEILTLAGMDVSGWVCLKCIDLFHHVCMLASEEAIKETAKVTF